MNGHEYSTSLHRIKTINLIFFLQKKTWSYTKTERELRSSFLFWLQNKGKKMKKTYTKHYTTDLLRIILVINWLIILVIVWELACWRCWMLEIWMVLLVVMVRGFRCRRWSIGFFTCYWSRSAIVGDIIVVVIVNVGLLLWIVWHPGILSEIRIKHGHWSRNSLIIAATF